MMFFFFFFFGGGGGGGGGGTGRGGLWVASCLVFTTNMIRNDELLAVP